MKSSVVKIMLTSIILFVLHQLLFNYLFEQALVPGIYKIHLFLGLMTLILVVVLERIRAKNQLRFGQVYLFSVVFKMFASVAFLLPFVLGQNSDEKMFVTHFFASFFIYLFMEVYLLVSVMKNA